MPIETNPEIDECVVVIQPVAEGELQSWGLVAKYSFALDDYIAACKTAIDHLVLEEIKVSHPFYSRLKNYLALSNLFTEKIRSDGDYETISSGDYQTKMLHTQIKDVKVTEERKYISTGDNTNDYSQTGISVIGTLANKYHVKYQELFSRVREKRIIGKVITI